MSKNINVKLTFSADTKAAQQQINQLQQTLNNIAATPVVGNNMKYTKTEIQEATQKAIELKVALNNATNVDTGKLNFSKFSQELKRNKTSLDQYAMAFKKLGPQGAQAFSELAVAIRQSETPLVQLQGRMAALGQTFMNTIKWSISSSLIQGVTQAFTSTIDYAKDLNESLTNIRIVTGKSVADVSKFAQEANKAAKALSATTDEYAKASLIYFQQGLSDSEVTERTETTLKLAKVVGESAETTSEWMTAIWNNFDDGSRSLENYADVLAKLGAATASSADEIAGGLEKFAAVAETVGLSYEYAASALATITAQTRQSEDVVGTALKTIFARVENLKLGDTLEDGTTLGQYSEALQKVGVNIKDSNGQLKKMDTILTDIGTTWGALDRDQQVALAQQVAGIRQYSQFMALMDNWDVMEDNIKLAKEANGALEDQHEIWETGIEGATSRVKEELNEIKNNLLDENDLLPMLNVAEGFLDFIGDLIDSLGGLPGLLSIIASVGLKIWGPQTASALQNMVSGIQSLYGGLSGKTEKEKNQAIVESTNLSKEVNAGVNVGDQEMGIRNQLLEKETELTLRISSEQNNLNSSAKEYLHLLQQIFEQKKKTAEASAREVDESALEILDAEAAIKRAAKGTTVTEEVIETDGNLKLVQSKETKFNYTRNGEVVEDPTTILNDYGEARGKAQSFQMHEYTADQSERLLRDAEDLGKTADKLGIDTGAEIGSIQNLVNGGQGLERESNESDEVYKERQKGLKNLQKEEESYQKLRAKGAKLNKDEKKQLETLSKTENVRKKAIGVSTNAINKQRKALAENVYAGSDATEVIEELAGGNKKAKEALTDYNNVIVKNTKAQSDSQKSFEDAEDAANSMGNTLDDNNNKTQLWSETFVGVMQGVASTAAGVQMMMGAFDSLSSAIADGSAGFSDYLSAITSVGFALPMLVNGLSSVSKVLKLDVLWKKLSAAATRKLGDETKKEAVEEEKASAKKFAAKLKDIGSSIAQWVAKGPGGWVIAALSAAAVAALIGISMAVNAKKTAAQEEEEDNKAIETAENALEVAEGWNEESQAMDELIAKHRQLKEANDQTIEGQKALKEAQQAIIDQVPKLIEKYKELDKEYEDIDLTREIAILEGAAENKDIDQIEQITNEIDNKIAEETSRIAKEGQEGAVGRTAAAMSELQGKVKDNKYTVRVGGKGTYVEGLLEDSSISENGNRINLRTDNAKNFLKDYEELQSIAKKAEETGHTEDDAYREIKELLAASEEQYTKLKELTEQGKAYEIQVKANELGFDPSNIKTYEQYVNEKNRLVEATVAAGIATKEEAEAWVEANKALSTYTSLEKRATAYSEKYGENYANSIKEYAKKLKSEEDLKAFIKIDFDKFQVQEQWGNLIEFTKTLNKAETLQAEVTAITTAEKNLKAKGTAEDYQKLQESLDWGKDGLIKYSDFLKGTYNQQKAYIEDIKIKKADAAKAEYNAALEQLKITYDQYELDLKDAKLKGDTRQTQQIEADMYWLRQKIEATEVAIGLAEIEAKQAREASAERLRNQKEKAKELNDEVDRYHEINEVIDDLSKSMDRLSKKKERAFGKDKVKLMQQELDVLDSQIAAQDILINKAKSYLDLDKQNLLKNNPNVQIDPTTGNITNYEEIQQGYLQRMASIGNPEDEAYKAIEAEYKLFKDYADKYEESYDKWEEEVDKKVDLANEKIDKNLEALNYSIEFNIEINDRQLKNLERLLEELDDDLYDSAERIQNLTQQMSVEGEKLTTNEAGIRNTLKTAGVSDADIESYMSGNGNALDAYTLTEETVENLKTYTDGYTESYQNMKEIRSQVEEEVMKTFEAWREEFERNGQVFEHASELVSNYRNIIDTVGRDRLGVSDKILKELNDAADKAAMGSYQNAAATMKFTQQALAKAQKAYDEATTEHDKEFWQNRIKDLTTQLQEDTAAAAQSWNDYLTQITESFQKNMEDALKTFEDAIAGANHKSLDNLADAFDKEQEVSQRYLKDYEKIYELSKLNREISKSIESTDNVRAQRILKDMQAEITAYQAEGKELSQYELENLQKKYQLRLAEIALEDAQNAKSQVRLSRDSQGNWSYVYTANEAATEDARQKYEDAMYDMQKSNDEYISTMQSNIIQNRQDLVAALAELNIQDFANAEEYQKARDEVIKYYSDKEAYYLEQMGIALDNNGILYDQDWQRYSEATGYKISSSEEWERDFADTQLAMQTGYSNIQTFAQGLVDAIGTTDNPDSLIGKMDAAYTTWESNFNEIMELAKEDLGGFGQKSETELGDGGTAQGAVGSFEEFLNNALYGAGGTKDKPNGGIVGGLDDAIETIGDVSSKASSSFGSAVNKATTFQKDFSPKIEGVKKKVDDLNGALDTLLSKNSPDIDVTINDNGTEGKLKSINEELNKIAENGAQTVTIKYNTEGGLDGKVPDDEEPDRPLKQYTIKEFGTYDNGYAAVKLEDGKWYTARSAGNASSATHKVGDTTTLMTGATALDEERIDKKLNLYHSNSKSVPLYKKVRQSTNPRSSFYNEYKIEQKVGEWATISNGEIVETMTYQGKKYARIKNVGWVAQSSISKYDTGGYTGEWGPDGRLAMLHQKEIVLNAHDTENFLAAIGIVRDISDQIEKNAIAIQYQNQLNNYKAMVGNGKDTLQQEVHITAEFPNATDRFEIEEAFRTLTNQASQFIHQR